MAARALLALIATAAFGAAQAETVTFPGEGFTLRAELFRPAGIGPFPAVVALHGCGGLYSKDGGLSPRHLDWAERLAGDGFLVLLPDSFGSRGEESQCRRDNRTVRAARERIDDALAAKDYLQSRSDVKADAVSLLGWSNGGSTVLYTLRTDARSRDARSRDVGSRDAEPRDARPRDARPRDARPRDAESRDVGSRDAEPRDAEPRDARPRDAESRDAESRDARSRDAKPRDARPFAKAVAFYPGCRTPLERGNWHTRIPLLVLIGEADDWTPAEPCRTLADDAKAAGEQVELVTYPGAYHDFDHPSQKLRTRKGLAFTANGNGITHTGTNPEARADAIRRVPSFLAR